MESTNHLFEQRLKRVNDAIELKEPDMVPLVPWAMSLPFELYPEIGATSRNTMYDYETCTEALVKYHVEFQPDAESSCQIYLPGIAGDFLKPTMMDWPGSEKGSVPETSGYQMYEIEYMKEDEYSELMGDYTGFVLNKMIPRMYEKLSGMADFRPNPLNGIFTNPLAGLAKPQVKESLQLLIDYIDEQEKSMGAYFAYLGQLEALGFPGFFTNVGGAPFDIISDYLRGTTGAIFDQMEQPEVVMAACNFLTGKQIEELAWLKFVDMPVKRTFFPLHKGMDGFMNDEDYAKYYWEPLQKVLAFLIDSGITPLVLTEGPYKTRYKYIAEMLKELPPGKVILGFEDMEFAEYKKAFKDVACLYGGISWHTLSRGTPEDVAEETKRLIDDAADGGGLIIGTSHPMDNIKRENVEALFETARSYGKAH